MSQRFNLKFDEMRQGSPVSTEEREGQYAGREEDFYYPSYGNGRDLVFMPLQGNIIALNYSFLIAKELDLSFTQMELTYSTHIITIKGYNLKKLLFDIIDQRVRILHCTDERYNALQPEGAPVVNEILAAPT